ncbi:MAG: lipocalin-like domain-containing protein [Candidatus Eisenbacteria bacterium]
MRPRPTAIASAATGGAHFAAAPRSLARIPSILAALAVSLALDSQPAAPSDFRDASTPWRFEFPRDHAAHPGFRTEWWYYTGHLEAEDRKFGFELTFFRVGLARAGGARASAWVIRDLIFAHAALTDETGRRFFFADTLVRPALGAAGADSARYRVWIDDWSAALASDGKTHRLAADAGRFAFELSLAPGKPPAIHGAGGISRKGSDPAMSSHYYSLTRMPARGRVRLDGEWREVAGEAWMDHEFMTTPERAVHDGWDWFALQFEDGRELMLYQLRLPGGKVEPHSSGTWVEADGRTRFLRRTDFSIEPTGTWRSTASGGRYPSGWRVRVPGESLDVTVTPALADQELRTRGIAAVTYWEGSVRVKGTRGGQAAAGRGYVELTGYSGRPPGQ